MPKIIPKDEATIMGEVPSPYDVIEMVGKKWLCSALRSYALYVIEQGKPTREQLYDECMLGDKTAIGLYASRMRELIEKV